MYQKQGRFALEGLVAEAPNFVITQIDAVFTRTIFVWADSFLSLVAMSHYGIVLFIACRMKNENGYRYNYGVEWPASALGYFVLLKLCNISYDVYFYLKQSRIYWECRSSIAETELHSCFHGLILDIVVGVVAFACYYLRDYRWSWYISPLSTVGLSL